MTLRFGEESLQEIARVSAEVRRLSASLFQAPDTFRGHEPFVSRSWTAFLERTAAVMIQSRLLLLPRPAKPVKMVDRSVLTVCLPTADATAVCLSHVQKSRLLPAFRLLTRVFALLFFFSQPAGEHDG